MRSRAWLALALLGACGGGDARVIEACEAHAPAHRRFTQWAARTLGADPGRTRAATEEMLFSPLFLDSSVVAARVTRGDAVFEWQDPIDASEAVTVRAGEAIYEVKHASVGGQPAVILGTHAGDLHVEVAYAEGASR